MKYSKKLVFSEQKVVKTLFSVASVISNCIYLYKKRMSSKIFIWRLNMDTGSSFSLVIIFFQSFTITHFGDVCDA